MRLRLSIQRNTLPPINILWSIPETSSPLAYTIARLLEDINLIVPLEAEHWGLEDYVVEVQGFECLHFSAVSQALKEDDLVSIRPLLTAEVRARTLTGRVQINDAGQHLVDGIPFGRPYLRKPFRPTVRIPPRKRQRLNEDTVAGDEVTETIGLITFNGEASHEDVNRSIMLSSVASPPQPNASGRSKTNKTNKTVHFEQPVVEEEEDSDEEDDEDFAPGEESPDSDVSMAESSEDDSDDSSDTSDASSSDSDSESDSDSFPDSSSDSGSDASSLSKTSKQNPPGKGQKGTRHRNHRRRDALRLRQLKAIGTLSPDTSLDEYRAWCEEDPIARQQQIEEAKKCLNSGQPPRKRKHGASQQANGAATSNTFPVPKPARDSTLSSGLTELERRKQELMAKMTEDDASPPATMPILHSPIVAPVSLVVASVSPTSAPSTPVPAEPARKRLRPDTSAIGRMLAHQTRQLNRKSAKSKTEAVPEPPQPIDPDLWKSKINLSAFECWEEDFELSAPPFPFQQHWDPASNAMRKKAQDEKQNQKKGRKRKRSPRDFPVEEFAEEVQLDYGDNPEANKVEDDNNAAIDSQLRQDVEVVAKSDLPPLPEDVELLPTLTQDDIKVGAIVAFKMLMIVKGAPEYSGFKTAVVEDEGDSGNGAGMIGLRLADRDREKTEHRFDKNGERIYSKADHHRLANGEEEDEDDGRRELLFMDLVEARLLQGAVSAA